MCPRIDLKINLLFALVTCSLGVSAQAVVLSPDYFLLNQTSGFAAYADCGVDMNGDFLDDVVRVGAKGIYIDFQQTDGSYLQRFFPHPIQSPPSWSICAGDLDNNGFNDLLFANGFSVSFLTANHSGTAYAETVMPVDIFSQRSTLADIDNDGWLDGFVCHDTDRSIPFRNDGAGNMSPDFTLINTSNQPGNYAAIWTDFDNDQDIDLYVSKCLASAAPGNPIRTNLLYQNNGNGTFSEIAAQTGLDDNSQSWSTVFEDFDNDGDFDAFIVNHDNQNLLLRNNGNPNGTGFTFTDVTAGSGIDASDLGAWENMAADFNNDGFMDIFSELEKELYLGNGDLTFTGQDAPVTPGAVGDFNNDGFWDVLRNSVFWMNEGNSNHWLKVNLLGLVGNRNGIGARVEIYGAWGMQSREVRSGQGFSPMGSLTAHFGLGPHTQVDSLKVKWPSGIVTTMSDLTADSAYLVPEADCLLPFSFIENDGDGLCPGDTLRLEAPTGFDQYLWSNGSTSMTTDITHPGKYFVILKDENGCVSLSNFIQINQAVDVPPTITAAPASRVCEGTAVVLSTTSSQTAFWSNGIEGPSITVTESGSYTVSTNAKCATGQLESLPFEVEALPSPSPFVSDASIVQGDSVLLFAEGENCHWYNAETGGDLLHIGPEFQSPMLAADEIYYVESHHTYLGEIQSGGKLDTLGEGGNSAQTGFMLFESFEPFTLLSVKVYLPPGNAEGVRFIQFFSPDTLLAVKQFQIHTGWNVLDLGFDVPVGQFTLRCPAGNLFRNKGALNYPYPIGEVGQIVNSSFGKNYYYYFYDWQVKQQDITCISDRVPLGVMVTGTAEAAHLPQVKIFPNPTDGQLFIKINEPPTSVTFMRLFDPIGREVLRREVEGSTALQLDFSSLPTGVYLLEIGGWHHQQVVVF